jgi:hypothetical protein
MKISALLASLLNIALFLCYTMEITDSLSQRLLYLYVTGTNTGVRNLSDAEVNLSEESNTVIITLHPYRRGTTCYKDVLRISNRDTKKTYYIGFSVDTAFDDAAIAEAELVVRDATTGALVGTVNLRSTGTTWSPWSLGAGGQLRVDLRFRVSSDASGSDSASIQLIYSPQSAESPP